MTSGASIRAASTNDLEAILGLQRGYPQLMNWSETLWSDLLGGDDAPLRRVWLAESGGALAGFVVLSVAADVGEFEMVLVDEAARGCGIGRALCGTAMQWAAAQGAVGIELEVRESNTAARALYASLGFVTQGVRRNYYHHPSEDAVLMRAALVTRDSHASWV